MDKPTILRDALQHKRDNGRNTQTRMAKALAMFLDHAVALDPDEPSMHYRVTSQTDPTVSYHVRTRNGSARCTCPDAATGRKLAAPGQDPRPCKHLLACYMAENAMQAARNIAIQKQVPVRVIATNLATALMGPQPRHLGDRLQALYNGAELAEQREEIEAELAQIPPLATPRAPEPVADPRPSRTGMPKQVVLIVRYPVSGGSVRPEIVGPGKLLEIQLDGRSREPRVQDPDRAYAWLDSNGYRDVAHRWIDGRGYARRRRSTFALDQEAVA